MARIPVDLAPEVAEAVRGADGQRFSKGAIKGAVRRAAGGHVTAAVVTELALGAGRRARDL